MQKKLNIRKNPYITSRASTAFQLGVIQALPNYNEGWLCSEFINLRYLPEDKIRCDFVHKDFWFTNANMFIRQSLLFSKDTLSFPSFDVIKYIISAIREGKYVTGDFNAYYIPNKLEYQIMHRRDTYLIYGYDLHNEIFYMMGDGIKGYSSHEIRFKDFLASISHRDDDMFNINIMELNPNFSFAFSQENLYKNLSDYTQSLAPDIYFNVASPIYGIDAIKQLRNDVLKDFGIGHIHNDKSFLMLWEHKKIMLYRFNYLQKHSNISIESLLPRVEDNLRLSEEIYQCCLKNKNSHDAHIYPHIIKLLDLLIDNEKSTCNALLSIL